VWCRVGVSVIVYVEVEYDGCVWWGVWWGCVVYVGVWYGCDGVGVMV
jgi:hypothetical protein